MCSNEIKNNQKLCLKAMQEIDQIFSKEKIWYSLSYGSALGAYREGGFIEWDGDIDIIIKRMDQERANFALKEGLSTNFELVSYLDNSVSGFDEIDIKGVSSDDMHIDIYPLIGGPDDIEKGYRFQKYCRLVHRVLGCKYLDIGRLQKKWKIPFVYAIRGIEFLFPDKILRKYVTYLEDRYSFETAKYVFPFANDGKRGEYMEKERLINRRKIQFENTEFYVPKDIEYYLEKIYGPDYMTPIRY